MKSLLLTISALITFNSFTVAQTSSKDFRGFNWGSSITQVKTIEKSKPWQINEVTNNIDDVLFYDDQLAGSDVTVIYQFNDDDKLINGSYIFGKKYSDPQLYLQDYEKFKELLTLKYGKPISDEEEWSSNTFPFIKENYGQAICDGYLNLITVWSTDNSIIKVVLLTLNNRPSLQIHHTAKLLNEFENKEALKASLPKL